MKCFLAIVIVVLASPFLVFGQGDFFWSEFALESGATNSEACLEHLPTDKGGSIYLYYSTNGPSDSDLEVGALLDVATSTSGVIRFTAAETYDFDITVVSAPQADLSDRWTGVFGETGSVSDNFIDEWGAFTVLANGIREVQNGIDSVFLDRGYDFGADAFLFGRVDYEIIGSGVVEVITTAGDGKVVPFRECNASAVNVVFGRATIVVTGHDTILGDVNLDGKVNLIDVAPFVGLLSSGGFQAEADFNFDKAVNLIDIEGFVQALIDNNTAPASDGGSSSGPMSGGTDCSGIVLGDVNRDGVVTFFDTISFEDLILSGKYQIEADTNKDGFVNLLDVPCFFEILIDGQ